MTNPINFYIKYCIMKITGGKGFPDAKGVVSMKKLKLYEYPIILLMAAGIFILLLNLGNTQDRLGQTYIPLNLEKMNLDDSGRYLEPIFDSVDIKKNMTYSTVQNEGRTENLMMDIYSPANDSEVSRPLIIWIHGGGFTGGDKSSASTICTDLARRGFVCASINYRLKSAPALDWFQTLLDTEVDTIAALEYLRTNCEEYGIDRDRIFLAGDSAGGIIALNTAFFDAPIQPDSDRGGIIGVVNIYGSDLWEYADVNDPPVLTMHGTNDYTVPYQASVNLVETLDKAGHMNDFITMYGIGHDYRADYDQVLLSMTYFIYNRLQVLNGAPFAYTSKTKPIPQGGSSLFVLDRTGGGEQFRGKVRVTPPKGWHVGGDMAVGDQKELTFAVKPPDYGMVTRMKLLYFDFLDEKDNFVSRIVVPVQVINPVSISVRKTAPGDGRRTVFSIANLGPNKFTGGTVTAVYSIGGQTHRDIQHFEEVASGGSAEVFFSGNMGERADFELVLNGGLTVNTFRQFIKADRANKAVVIDGSLDEWRQAPLFTLGGGSGAPEYDWGGMDDLSAAGFVQWDEKNLYIGVEVTDDNHSQAEEPDNLWQGDSVRIAIDPRADAGSVIAGYHELGFALGDDGTLKSWRWIAPPAVATGDISGQVSFSAVRNGVKTVYEAAIPWEFIMGNDTEGPPAHLGFSLLINENDGNGHRGFMEYMGGIGSVKDPGLFGIMALE